MRYPALLAAAVLAFPTMAKAQAEGPLPGYETNLRRTIDLTEAHELSSTPPGSAAAARGVIAEAEERRQLPV